VEQSAHKYNNPDNRFGYGIPNFRKAYELLQALRDIREKDSVTWLKAYPVPVPRGTFKLQVKAPGSGKATIHLFNVLGR
jgi:hypothetical protein